MSLQCYNKGCGKKFDPNQNTDGSCQHHPGAPIFHDALKGWSCCKKKSIDFSEFLSIPGCAKGLHTNVKPVDPETVKLDQSDNSEVIVEAPRKPIQPPNKPADRPPQTECMVELKKNVGATLKQALDKQMKDLGLQKPQLEENAQGTLLVGTTCKNNACGKTYEGEQSKTEECIHHPGVPIFHEGLKFWSCCKKKTTEFDNFLQQQGCSTGTHVWMKQEDPGERKSCRYDWHQTGSNVVISVFCKVAMPEKSKIEANRVSCNVHIVFEGGKSLFEQKFVFRGVIDPEKSSVKMVGTKVEINLKKAEPFHWPDLCVAQKVDLPEGSPSNDTGNGDQIDTVELGF